MQVSRDEMQVIAAQLLARWPCMVIHSTVKPSS